MPRNKRKIVAKGLILLYIFISATFELSHTDYIPLEGTRIIVPSDTPSHHVAANGSDFVCPAHNFAQSTHAAGVVFSTFSPAVQFVFIFTKEPVRAAAIRPLLSDSRAPPAA